jgi:hypothetical protein
MSSQDSDATEFFMWVVVLGAVALNIFVDRNVYPQEVTKSQELCKEANAELKEFNVGSFEIDVSCSNGAKFTFDAKQVPDLEEGMD